MLYPLERMMWQDEPEGPSGGGGGNSKNINPKLPLSVRRGIVLPLQQSQWYNTTVKVPVIINSLHQENINITVQGLQEESYSVNIPVKSEETSKHYMKLPVRIEQDHDKTISQIVRHGSSNNINIKIPTIYYDNEEITNKYTIKFEDYSNNKLYAPVRLMQNVNKKITWKVTNIKLLDIIDLL